jgi:hypothetical protein
VIDRSNTTGNNGEPSGSPARFRRGSVALADRDPRRSFTEKQKDEIYERQNRCCAGCGRAFTRRHPGRHGKDNPERWEGYPPNFDHVERWADGGRTEVKNGVALCRHCHSCVKGGRPYKWCPDCHGEKQP